MAVSESVLNAVNLFSSTSVFDANKGSVGATDLNFIKQTTAELATEGGGIIAQSLGTNGYVKFANGLILQWGFVAGTSSATVIFRYPISCSSVLVLFSIHRYSTSTEQVSFRTEAASYEIPTTSSAQIRLHSNSGGGKYVMLLCKQQWGYRDDMAKNSAVSITMPISFTSYQTCSASWMSAKTRSVNAGYTGDGYAVVTSNTVISVLNGNSAGINIYWFALGT